MVAIYKCETLELTRGVSPAGACRVESKISSLIGATESGDSAAADTLFSTLYSELHRMAKRELARWGAPASLNVTTLLHEAYLDISAREGKSFPDRPRFMGYAARVMRGLIIDHARSRNAIKRGRRVRNHFAKNRCRRESSRRRKSSRRSAMHWMNWPRSSRKLAELVDLKFFCGFTFAEIAALSNVSERTVQTKLGKGAHLSPSHHSRGFVALRY